MMKSKPRFYVVWRGRETGIFGSRPETEARVKGYSGARYKSFWDEQEALAALAAGPDHYRVALAEVHARADGVVARGAGVTGAFPRR